MRVLLIDDDEWQLKSLENMLEGIEIQCVSYSSVTDEVLNRINSVDAILLDILMPGIDGIEVLKRISEKQSRVPVYLVSGLAPNVLESLKETGCKFGLNIRMIIHKPVTIEALKALKQDLVDVNDRIVNARLTESERLNSIVSLDLEVAMEQWWFLPYFQLQYDAPNNAFTGVECLARLNHPVIGLVSPAVFIEKLEEKDLIDEFTLKFAEQTCITLTQNSLWQSIRHMSLNVSAKNLTISFANALHKIISRYIKPEECVLEITETVRLADKFEARLAINKLAMYGYGLSLDDFGTGQSTISQLNELPFSELKVDRQFVSDIGQKKTAEAIITATVEIAKELDYRLLAEGVENGAHFAYLQNSGCRYFQGYYFSRPVPAEELEKQQQAFFSRAVADQKGN